jgi:hypothetical protein
LWPQVWDPPLALQLLQDGNDVSEAQLNDLVEYGTLRVVSAEALDAEETEDVARAIDGAWDEVQSLEAANADNPDQVYEDRLTGADDPEGLPWDAGHDPDGPSGAAGSDFDGDEFDEPTGVY